MTGRSAIDNPRERKTDGMPAWAVKVLGFWQAWGLLVTGLWLIGVSIVLLFVTLAFVHSQDKVERQALHSCVLTKRIGPYIVEDYDRRGVMPSKVLAEYRALIPKSCKD